MIRTHVVTSLPAGKQTPLVIGFFDFGTNFGKVFRFEDFSYPHETKSKSKCLTIRQVLRICYRLRGGVILTTALLSNGVVDKLVGGKTIIIQIKVKYRQNRASCGLLWYDTAVRKRIGY